MSRASAPIFALLLAAASLGAAPEVAAAPTVGMEGRVEVVLPGARLEATPVNDKSPLVVRIASAKAEEGGFRYDFRYIGLEPGKYDLRQYLFRADGSPSGDLSAIPVAVDNILPPSHAGDLVGQGPRPFGFLRGYRALIVSAVVLWALLLVPLILVGRKKPLAAPVEAPPPPPTLADRLRPLVRQAAEGTLSADGKGQLERMLLSHWRDRVGLTAAGMGEAIVQLRQHPEAGALLRALEDWLHRPPGAAQVDVGAVLTPYANVPAREGLAHDAVPAGSNGEAVRI